jgi:hypothetical protein
MPARVRSERQSLSNCANAASTPSINFPVDVSSIGSVAERNEIPSELQMRTECKVIVLVAGEARQVEHDHEVDASLVQPTAREQVLKLAAVGRLGALAFFVEAFVAHLDAGDAESVCLSDVSRGDSIEVRTRRLSHAAAARARRSRP